MRLSFVDYSPPPSFVNRVIVHQFDPSRASPGGIDTCIRGICRYLPLGQLVAIIGVDTGSGPTGRRLGQWELHKIGEQEFWFLPVSALDPADQSRRIPHSIRLMAGVIAFRGSIPKYGLVQAHRMDTAAALRMILPGRQVYCIHTQENGLTGSTSDSFWRFFGSTHQMIERSVVRNAQTVIVFNEDYANFVKAWNPNARFSPTWYDPALIDGNGSHGDPHAVLWVGRLETPKDPELAVNCFVRLVSDSDDAPWSLHLLGSGTRATSLRQLIQSLPERVRSRVHLHGRVPPEAVASHMANSGVLLMTSHPGYEGYPRVLVEAMASGLPVVVTVGSDTGNLVESGSTGYVCNRDPDILSAHIKEASRLDRSKVRSAVANFDAPTLVGRIFSS